MAKAKKHGTGINFLNVVERLITKLYLVETLVGTEQELKKSQLINKFWTEHSQLTSHTGVFDTN